MRARTDTIVRLRAVHQAPWAEIAQAVGMTERGCKAAYAAWQNGGDALVGEDGVEIVQRKLASVRHVRAQLLETLEAAHHSRFCRSCGEPCGHVERPGVAAGAARAVLAADQQEVVLRQLVGLLPRDLGELRPVITGRALSELFYGLLMGHLGMELTAEKVAMIGRAFAAAATGQKPHALPNKRPGPI